MKHLSLLPLLVFLGLCPVKGHAQDSLRVLFLGNSLTYSNDIPNLINELAQSNSDRFTYAEHTPGGWRLNPEHLGSSVSTNLIRSRQWDYVILQGQSREFFYENEYTTYKGIRRLVTMMRENCSRPAFYSTAAPRTLYKELQAYIHRQYSLIANEVDGLVVPVGNAFEMATDRGLTVYADKVHPNLAGSYLAACTFYAAMYQKSPIGLSFTAGLPASQVATLQSIADQAVMGHFKDLNIHPTVQDTCFKSIGLPQPATLAATSFTVYPNPAQSSFTLEVHSKAGMEARLIVYNAQGRAVFEEKIALKTGMNRHTYPADLPTGMYTLSLHPGQNGLISSQKLLVL